jgi:hypothetical protein
MAQSRIPLGLEIENLSGQKDAAAQGCSAHGVQRQAEGAHARHQGSRGKVETHHHGQYQQESLGG